MITSLKLCLKNLLTILTEVFDFVIRQKGIEADLDLAMENKN